MIDLGINIDHVATLRQARRVTYPDPVEAARIAIAAGADLITLHLREDCRHIQDRDVVRVMTELDTRVNLEAAVTTEMIGIALRLHPDDVCLVPERRAELTTEGGLDVRANQPAIRAACGQLGDQGIRVSLFIDPDIAQIDAAVACGAPVIEIHTGRYAEFSGTTALGELDRIRVAASYALGCGLKVNAGHGLHYENVLPVAAVTQISELNIGHSIVARSVFVGFEQAVKEMKALIVSTDRR